MSISRFYLGMESGNALRNSRRGNPYDPVRVTPRTSAMHIQRSDQPAIKALKICGGVDWPLGLA